MTSSSITVQWGAVDCIHRNGDITGYLVQRRVWGSGNKQTLHYYSDDTETTIAGLVSSTEYYTQVAAVNNAGIGVYSTIVLQLTHGIASYE